MRRALDPAGQKKATEKARMKKGKRNISPQRREDAEKKKARRDGTAEPSERKGKKER